MATATRPGPASEQRPDQAGPGQALAPARPARPDTPNWQRARRPLVAPPRERWHVAGALTLLLAVSALFPQPLLRDAESPARGAAAGVALARPALYTVLAPLTTSLDELTLLSVRQHLALIAGALLVFAVWRALRRRGALRPGRPRLGALGETASAVAFLAAILAVHTVGCLVPRPMAALVVRDPDLVRVDFHAHTAASHDGRARFDAERLRRWHRDGGFDVAYVTDHGTYTGAEAGAAGNPALAGEGTVLLSGVEAWSGGEHLNVLGATAADVGLLTPDEEIDEAVIARAVAAGRRAPVLIETVPGFLDTLARGLAGGLPGRAIHRVTAVELSDAAPRGFEQTDSTYERVLHLADSLNLAVVAGSDNHGWGRTVAAWSLVAVPGWRDLPPEALGLRLERRILEARRQAVRVVERDRPRTIRGPAVLLNAPVVLWHLFASLAPAERLSWLVWTWTIAAAWRHARPRRRPPPLRVVQ